MGKEKPQIIKQFGNNTMMINRQEAIMKFDKFVERGKMHLEELHEQMGITKHIIMSLTQDYERELNSMREESSITSKYVKGLEDYIQTHMTSASVPSPKRDDFVPKKCQTCGIENGHKKECPSNSPQ